MNFFKTVFVTTVLLQILLIPVFTQDITMHGSTSDAVLVDVQNTGSSTKTNIQILDENISSKGIQMDIGSTAPYGFPVGIYTTVRSGSYANATGSRVEVLGGGGGTNYGYRSNVTSAGDDYSYGYRAWVTGGTSSRNYGVFATASGGTFSAAGYFSGNVWANNYYSISDRQFKADIKDYENGLAKIMALKPRTYKMKVQEFKDRVVLPPGDQIGFVAQEIEAVLPELVTDAVEPSHSTGDGANAQGTTYKSVNYDGIIPVLVKAMQEQQLRIETLEAELRGR